jgi:hypothetical protein
MPKDVIDRGSLPEITCRCREWRCHHGRLKMLNNREETKQSVIVSLLHQYYRRNTKKRRRSSPRKDMATSVMASTKRIIQLDGRGPKG